MDLLFIIQLYFTSVSTVLSSLLSFQNFLHKELLIRWTIFSKVHPGISLVSTKWKRESLRKTKHLKIKRRASLVAQWLRICLPQCRGHGFEPWSGKIPHAAEQLGPWATTTEPARLEPVLRNERGHDSERPAHSDEEWPPLATTRESPSTETKTQHSNQSINK